jgi:beta-1,4-mannooligosaccharide/beta-1,4-mannosyl-N-acetylglucosamine phosphorylase
MPEYSRGYKELFDIWLSKSPDCRYWGDSQLVMGLEKVPFANAKIGPAAPPIKTSEGWLATFHATYKDPNRDLLGWEIANNPKAVWHKEYLAGLMLLDLKNPAKVLAISSKPVIKAAEKYELDGFRGSVIFPGGMLLEPNGEVKVYYGASDTVECLATATVDELLKSLDITF